MNLHKIGILTFLMVLFAANAHALQQTRSDSLDQFIMAQAERFRVPGIAVGVVKGDELVWSKGYGWANLENQTRMNPQSVLNIASVSKTVTATAVMQLWERGLIDLDADVNTYLDFDVQHPLHPGSAITVRQLLTHTSSIRDGSVYKKGYACGDPSTTLNDWIENYFSENGTFYAPEENYYEEGPGEIYRYSNVAFGLLGAIVESSAGMPFHAYVKQHIFEPLEMHHSGYFLSEMDTTEFAVPYLYLGPLQKQIAAPADTPLPYYNPYCFYSFWNYPDGLVRTSVEDLAHFAIAYMNEGVYNGKRILKGSTIEMMHRSQLSEEINEDADQGFSWFYSPGLDPSWFHGGSDPGVSTRLYVDRINKIGVIVLQNANSDNAFFIARELYNAFK